MAGRDILFVLQLRPDFGILLRDVAGLPGQFRAHPGEILDGRFVYLLRQAEPFAEDGIVFQLLHFRLHERKEVVVQYLLVLLDTLLYAADDAGDASQDTGRTTDHVSRHDATDAAGDVANIADQLGRCG